MGDKRKLILSITLSSFRYKHLIRTQTETFPRILFSSTTALILHINSLSVLIQNDRRNKQMVESFRGIINKQSYLPPHFQILSGTFSIIAVKSPYYIK